MHSLAIVCAASAADTGARQDLGYKDCRRGRGGAGWGWGLSTITKDKTKIRLNEGERMREIRHPQIIVCAL